MGRKFLKDIGYEEEKIKHSKKRKKRLAKQRKKYGFDEVETWSLKDTFYRWLYERLKMYMKVADPVVDLNFHKFEYKSKTYTQRELILKLIDLLKEHILSEKEWYEINDEELPTFVDRYEKRTKEICEIWGIILPTMWW
jgi:hypothetical protein